MCSFLSPCSPDFRVPPHFKKKGLQFNSSFSRSQSELSTEASGEDIMLNFRLNFLFYNSFSLNSFNVYAFWSYKLPVWFLVWDSAEPGIMLLGLAEGDLHPFSWNLRHALVRNSITLPSIALSLLAISATNLEIHLSFFNIQAKCQFSPLKPRFEWFWTLFLRSWCFSFQLQWQTTLRKKKKSGPNPKLFHSQLLEPDSESTRLNHLG